jgi:hypothetical protein
MKAVSACVFAILLETIRSQFGGLYPMGGVPGGYFGGQPNAYGPNYPQVQGVNVPSFGMPGMGGPGAFPGMMPPTGSAANAAVQNRLANTPNTEGPIFPQCSTLDSIGSPVLLIYQAQEIINKLLDPKNANSYVNYLYYSMAADNTNGLFNLYNLIYSLSDFTGTYYAGLRFRVARAGVSDQNWSQSGLGSAEFLKFILNQDLAVVNATLGLPVVNNGMPDMIKCGDLKFIYSSYGNNAGSAVPGSFPGENRNGALSAMIEEFKAKEQSFTQVDPNMFKLFNRDFITLGTAPATYPRWIGWLQYLREVTGLQNP